MPPPPGTPAEPSSFEEHLEALEQVVADLEGDGLSLEASIERYKAGVAHLAACRRILDAAEQRLSELVAAADGSVAEKPLSVGAEGLVDAGPPVAVDPSPRAKPRKRPPAPGPQPDDLPF